MRLLVAVLVVALAPPAYAHHDYTVRRGDSLSAIASRLDVPGGWRRLHWRNRGRIADPHVIHAGQRLVVPHKPKPVAPRRTQRTSRAAGVTQRLNSTAYCLTGRMANGQYAHDGAVAVNNVPFGTRYHVHTGPLAGRTFVVKDRVGWGSEFDVAMPGRCQDARNYGRRTITVERR